MGVDGLIIAVEVDSAAGLPAFDIGGLPDTAVRESKERVRTAIRNSGIQLRQEKVTINLAPADIRKDSSGLDLPIAVGLLASIVATRLATRAGLPSLLLFLGVGVLLGEDGIGLRFDDVTLARDLGPDGIRVNCVTPGLIGTDISKGKLTEEKKAEIAAGIPLNRLGKPEEVASLVHFLCTRGASYINGSEIHVNGGQHV